LDQFVPIRQKELRTICDGIRNDRCISLVGESGSGKSSLLTFLRLDKRSKSQYGLTQDFVFGYIDFYGTKTEADFYRALARFLEEEHLFPPGIIEGERLWQVIKWLSSGGRGKSLVLLLDHFDGIRQGNFSLDCFNNMKSIAESCNVCLVTASTKKLHEIAPDELHTSFFGSFLPVFLGSMSQDEFELFVEEPSRKFGNPLKGYNDSIRKLAGGLPAYVIRACHYYFAAWIDHKVISKEDEKAIYEKFMNDCDSRFDYVWKQCLDDGERQVVRALAAHRSEEQQSLLESNLLDPSAAASLIRKGYIVDNRLFSLAFADFIRQQVIKPLIPPQPPLDRKPSTEADVWRDPKGDVWVRRDDEHIRIAVEKFSSKEYAFFNLLYDNCGKPCSRGKIWEAVWPEYKDWAPDPDSIFQVVSRLREIIEPAPKKPRYIITVRAVGGYKLVGCT